MIMTPSSRASRATAASSTRSAPPSSISSNLASAHKDFGNLGLAVDLALLDRPLAEDRLRALVDEAARETGDPEAIRSVRQVLLA